YCIYCVTHAVHDIFFYFFFFSSRRRHTRSKRDWSSDVCSSDLVTLALAWIFYSASLYHDQLKSNLVLRLLSSPFLAPFARLCFRSEERRVGKECRSRWSP